MDHGLPGSSVRGTLQARILEWVAISFSQVLLFFSKDPDVFLMSSYVVSKDVLNLLFSSSLFHFFYFIFTALISFSLHFPIALSLFVVVVLSQAFIKYNRKAFNTYLYSIYNIYIIF